MSCIQFVASIYILAINCIPNISATPSSNVDLQHDSGQKGLIFAHVIYRHGDRNIDFKCPNDPYKDEIHWPDGGGYGQLTNAGKRRHFRFGQYLRKRYSTLIGDKYSPYKVYIRSTDIERTIMSALANLAGLFYPTDEEKWNENILWQPIPVHTVPIDSDYVFYGWYFCPKYKVALDSYFNESSESHRIHTEYADQFDFWSRMCGLNISSTQHVLKLYKTLNIEMEQNKTLPDWARKAIEPNGTMAYIAAMNYKLQTDTKQLARLFSGFLIKEMLDHFFMKRNSTLRPDRLLWIYSAHENTIIGFLNSVGLFKELHLPPYASSLHFELYKSDANEHYVQLFYKQFDGENILPLNIPNCGEKCPLDRFYELFADILPGDYHSECHST